MEIINVIPRSDLNIAILSTLSTLLSTILSTISTLISNLF
jgi:hypothetical protein